MIDPMLIGVGARVREGLRIGGQRLVFGSALPFSECPSLRSGPNDFTIWIAIPGPRATTAPGRFPMAVGLPIPGDRALWTCPWATCYCWVVQGQGHGAGGLRHGGNAVQANVALKRSAAGAKLVGQRWRGRLIAVSDNGPHVRPELTRRYRGQR